MVVLISFWRFLVILGGFLLVLGVLVPCRGSYRFLVIFCGSLWFFVVLGDPWWFLVMMMVILMIFFGWPCDSFNCV